MDLAQFASPTAVSSLDSKLTTLGADLESSNRIIGFARVDGLGALKSFGGRGATGASAVRIITGIYNVTFSGDWPELGTTDSVDNHERLTLLGTPHSNDFEVANHEVVSATRTQIVVRFYTWKSTLANTINGQGGFVGVLLGEKPGNP